MITAMFFAHITGDFILQTDRLAHWKATCQKGVLTHGLIVLLVTWLFSLPFDRGWWPWVLFIGLSHTAIDSLQLWLAQRAPRPGRGPAALIRFCVDQALHFTIILIALAASGYLPLANPAGAILAALQQTPRLTLLMGYAFLLMPAWVIVKILVYSLVGGSPPNFAGGTDKYAGMLERLLITTFILLGQYVLVPLVTLPRLLAEGREVRNRQQTNLYVAELLASVTLAVITGLGIRLLAGS